MIENIDLPPGLEINDFITDPIYIEMIHFLDMTFPRWRYADGLGENSIDFLYDNHFFAEETILGSCDNIKSVMVEFHNLLEENYRELLNQLSKDRDIELCVDFIFDENEKTEDPLTLPLDYSEFVLHKNKDYYFDLDKRGE